MKILSIYLMVFVGAILIGCSHFPAGNGWAAPPSMPIIYGPIPATATCEAVCVCSLWIFSWEIGRKSYAVDYHIYPVSPDEKPTARVSTEAINLHTRIKNEARTIFNREKCDQLKIFCLTIGGKI